MGAMPKLVRLDISSASLFLNTTKQLAEILQRVEGGRRSSRVGAPPLFGSEIFDDRFVGHGDRSALG
jgi:hypothetical protein